MLPPDVTDAQANRLCKRSDKWAILRETKYRTRGPLAFHRARGDLRRTEKPWKLWTVIRVPRTEYARRSP